MLANGSPEWSGAAFDGLRIHDLLTRHADERPDAIAAVDGDLRLTYADLRARVDALAKALIGAGVAPGDRAEVRLVRHGRVRAICRLQPMAENATLAPRLSRRSPLTLRKILC